MPRQYLMICIVVLFVCACAQEESESVRDIVDESGIKNLAVTDIQEDDYEEEFKPAAEPETADVQESEPSSKGVPADTEPQEVNPSSETNVELNDLQTEADRMREQLNDIDFYDPFG